jgi:hypothetical protein
MLATLASPADDAAESAGPRRAGLVRQESPSAVWPKEALCCFAASGIGLLVDGPRAFLFMQGVCGDLSLLAYVESHFLVLPATCASMLLASGFCCAQRWEMATLSKSLRLALGFTFMVLVTFVAMMAVMMAVQLVARQVGDLPLAALLAIAGANVLFLGLMSASRRLLGSLWRRPRSLCNGPAASGLSGCA